VQWPTATFSTLTRRLFSIVRDMRIRRALVTATTRPRKKPRAMYAAGLSFREIEPCYFGPNARLHKRSVARVRRS
jgi:hypothetical protein